MLGAAVGPIGFVGYGRFGAALAALCGEAGLDVRAMDERPVVPESIRATSLAELSAATKTLVVWVPVSRVNETLAALRPHVGPDHVVMDVASVKKGPVAALRDVLGTAVPWVGTHPLFGPASLARGERPLRVVLCPAAEH